MVNFTLYIFYHNFEKQNRIILDIGKCYKETEHDGMTGEWVKTALE